MAKRPNPLPDLLTIGMFAPIVVASRLQSMAMESVRPTPKSRREMHRMIAEKPIAMAEGAMAAQKQMFDSGLKFWSAFGSATSAFLLTAPAASLAVAAVPVRRRVRANARRLTGF